MDLSILTPVFLITLAAFGLAVAAMAVGVIFSGRCLHGSCGGPELRTRDGLSLRCLLCPSRRRGGDGPEQRGGAGS
jgi:hypothetical protein